MSCPATPRIGPVCPYPEMEQYTTRGFTAESVSYSTPRRCATPGRNPSTTTSACSARARKIVFPSSVLRLSVRLFFPRFKYRSAGLCPHSSPAKGLRTRGAGSFPFSTSGPRAALPRAPERAGGWEAARGPSPILRGGKPGFLSEKNPRGDHVPRRLGGGDDRRRGVPERVPVPRRHGEPGRPRVPVLENRVEDPPGLRGPVPPAPRPGAPGRRPPGEEAETDQPALQGIVPGEGVPRVRPPDVRLRRGLRHPRTLPHGAHPAVRPRPGDRDPRGASLVEGAGAVLPPQRGRGVRLPEFPPRRPATLTRRPPAAPAGSSSPPWRRSGAPPPPPPPRRQR